MSFSAGGRAVLFIYMVCAMGITWATELYRWVDDPAAEMQRMNTAEGRLEDAIKQPEYMLHHWVNLPTSPTSHSRKVLHLSLREAILLSLRYNPNIQNAELCTALSIASGT